MPFTASQRPTREWPWLVLALALVGAVCIPLWQYAQDRPVSNKNLASSAASALGQAGGIPTLWQPAWTAETVLKNPAPQPTKWTSERLSRLFLGPEQIICYAACVWAGFILLSRWLEVRRQYQAFRLNLLDTDAGACILPEDARLMQRRIDQSTASRGPFILVNLIRLALGKYAISRSGRDVSETIRTQADIELGRLVSSMATVHYLAWAIPAIGFLGTVRGLATSLTLGGDTKKDIVPFIKEATGHLNVAFDCTLIALALSLVVMFLLHSVQRDEEAMVLDCQQYCLEHLVGRLYDLEPDRQTASGEATPASRGFT